MSKSLFLNDNLFDHKTISLILFAGQTNGFRSKSLMKENHICK